MRSVRTLLLSATLLAGSGILLLGGTAPAHATSLAALSSDQMVDASDIIVIGRVADVWGGMTVERHIATFARVQVEETLKGQAPGSVEVVTPGGVYAGVTSNVEGAPRFGLDEQVLLYLSTRSDGSYLIVGLSQGKFTIRQNPADGQDMVVNFTAPASMAWDPRFIPHPPVSERVALADIRQRILSRVQAGWDGQPIPGLSADRLNRINTNRFGVR